jgi:hypothetical protein
MISGSMKIVPEKGGTAGRLAIDPAWADDVGNALKHMTSTANIEMMCNGLVLILLTTRVGSYEELTRMSRLTFMNASWKVC